MTTQRVPPSPRRFRTEYRPPTEEFDLPANTRLHFDEVDIARTLIASGVEEDTFEITLSVNEGVHQTLAARSLSRIRMDIVLGQALRRPLNQLPAHFLDPEELAQVLPAIALTRLDAAEHLTCERGPGTRPTSAPPVRYPRGRTQLTRPEDTKSRLPAAPQDDTVPRPEGRGLPCEFVTPDAGRGRTYPSS